MITVASLEGAQMDDDLPDQVGIIEIKESALYPMYEHFYSRSSKCPRDEVLYMNLYTAQVRHS